jgi:PAS domain-containing protein
MGKLNSMNIIKSESTFRLLFERSADAMLLLDGDVFIDCNPAAVEMFACSGKKQLLSLHPSDLSPEKQPDGRFSHEKEKKRIAKALENLEE